jgi:2-polyprenyl-6-methoxyphenol hydroxylase-like FAD-dependent oxidoreductase
MSSSHAVVIGAGFAGLCAARVLARTFDRVTLLERDRLPTAAEDRPGVPQGRHVHALLARGLLELERSFPGFRSRARELGAVEMDMGLETAMLRSFGWAPRQNFGVPVLLASRRLFETVVRERCRAIENLVFRDGTTVVGFCARPSSDGLRVDGVRVAGDGGEAVVPADLVVDAGGRAGKTPEWLRAIGVEPPPETVVDGRWGYSTRWYEAPEKRPVRWWWRAIVLEGRPPEMLRGGVLIPVEGGRWMVTIGGANGEYPPTDEAGFANGLRALRSPLIADAVALARPISPIYGTRTMSNRLCHYERWKRRLGGFIAVGDAVSAFNPIYGQGMTTATLCARALESALAGSNEVAGAGFARSFFALQARAQRDAWTLATGADLRLPKTEGRSPLGVGFARPYFDALVLATRSDPVVHQRFFEVLQMLKPVSSFFAPTIVARVVRDTLIYREKGTGCATSPSPFPGKSECP